MNINQNLSGIIIGLGIIFGILKIIFNKNTKISIEFFPVIATFSLISILTYDFNSIENKFDISIKIFILIITLGIFYFIPSYRKQNDKYKLISNIVLFGALSAISANNFLNMFVAVELTTIPLYFIIYDKKNLKKEPSYFKYMLLSSGIEIFAISIIYAASKSVDFLEIGYTFVNSKLLSIGLIILFFAFCIKIAMLPFSKWLIDAFNNEKIPTLAFILLISKCAIFFIILKIFQMISCPYTDFILATSILIGISMVVSPLLAICQNDIKKILAYISIEHGSLIFAGALAVTDQTIVSTTILIVADILSLYGMLVVLDVIFQKREIQTLQDLSNISIESTNLKLALSIIILSLAGIPPTLCFWGKYYIVLSIINSGNYYLIACICLSIVFSGIYAIKILKNIWSYKNNDIKIDAILNEKIVYVIAILQIILPLAISYFC